MTLTVDQSVLPQHNAETPAGASAFALDCTGAIRQVLDGIEFGANEVFVDETTRKMAAGSGDPDT